MLCDARHFFLADEVSGSNCYTSLLAVVIYMCSMLSGSVVVAPVFLAGYPPSRCRVEPFDNKTLYPNITNELIQDAFIPWNPTFQSYDRCTRKMIDCENIEVCLKENVTVKETSCNGSCIYDRNNYEETVITEWNLVCNDYTWVTLSTSLSFFGAFLGSGIGGFLGDRYGRILVLRCVVISLGALGCALTYSPNMLTYTVIHFFEVLAAIAGVVGLTTYVLEIVPLRWRTVSGVLANFSFGLGYTLLSFYATNWRKWREQHLVKTLTMVIPVFLATLLLPKSPRWLFAHDQKSEAKKICRLFAKRNNTKLQDSTWATVVDEYKKESSEETSAKNNTLKESFHRPYTRFLVVANMFVYFSCSLVFYGLTMNSGSLAGDPYLNNALSGLMEMLSCLVSIASIYYLGFLKTIVGSFSIATAACLISTITIELGREVDEIEKVGTSMAMLGKFGATMAFSTVFIQTPLLFPTCGRSTILGLASMAARIGSIFTPWTIQLQYTIPWLTQAIFGVVSLFGAIVASFFPETKDYELTMTYEEAEKFFRKTMKDSMVARIFGLPRKKSTATEKERKSLVEKTKLVA